MNKELEIVRVQINDRIQSDKNYVISMIEEEKSLMKDLGTYEENIERVLANDKKLEQLRKRERELEAKEI